jgi:RNA polymerase sigma-70 factor, ECF subfamily
VEASAVIPINSKPSPITAPALVHRSQTGDPRALDALIRAIRPRVVRWVGRYPVSEQDRLDLVQSTLLQVVRTIRNFRGDSSFDTWLFRVTANLALMLMRSQRPHFARLVDCDPDDLGTLPVTRTTTDDDAAWLAERRAHVRTALGELPADYRECLIAHYHEELGLEEIAHKLMVSETTVRSRIHRARVRLRAVLGATAFGRELAADMAA